MCCSVLQCVAVCCSVLQCVAVCSHVYTLCIWTYMWMRQALCSVLQCVSVCSYKYMICCSVLQCVAVCSHTYTMCTRTYTSMGHAHYTHRCLAYVHVRICIVYIYENDTGWQRHIGCLIFIGHFPQKSSILSGSFANNDLQLDASYGSWPPCTCARHLFMKM